MARPGKVERERNGERQREKRGRRYFLPGGLLVDFPFLSFPQPSPYPLRRSCATRIGALRARDACFLVSYSLRRPPRTHVRSSRREAGPPPFKCTCGNPCLECACSFEDSRRFHIEARFFTGFPCNEHTALFSRLSSTENNSERITAMRYKARECEGRRQCSSVKTLYRCSWNSRFVEDIER